ncbi:MAG: LicD family protein [bacterium]|nr:LicD family protein [bacterium]
MKKETFFDKVFSVKDYGETHSIMRILGIKIKFQKPEYAKKLSQNPYNEYKKRNADITTLPAAEGQIRDIQLANFALLKEFDRVCRKEGITYWLFWGTMLGAVRHKGFIPWDDDIDVGMMRDEYEKLVDIFNNSVSNSDIYAEKTYLGHGQVLIKVKHKKCDYIFVDIFPHDFMNNVLSEKERAVQIKKMYELRKKLNKDAALDTVEKVTEKVKRLNSQIIRETAVENSDVLCGLENFYDVAVFSYDTFFPVKEIEFEGCMFLGMNNPEKYLSDTYGDYMAYPKKIGMGHSAYAKIPEEQMKIIKELKETI